MQTSRNITWFEQNPKSKKRAEDDLSSVFLFGEKCSGGTSGLVEKDTFWSGMTETPIREGTRTGGRPLVWEFPPLWETILYHPWGPPLAGQKGFSTVPSALPKTLLTSTVTHLKLVGGASSPA